MAKKNRLPVGFLEGTKAFKATLRKGISDESKSIYDMEYAMTVDKKLALETLG